MQSAWIKYLPQAIDILLPLLLALLAWLAAEAAKYIRTKTVAGATRDALLRLDDASLAVVSQLAQSMAGNLKQASADGKLTPEEIAILKKEALLLLLSYLGKEVSPLQQMFGEDALKVMMQAKIEQAVVKIKSAPVGGSADGNTK